METLLLNKTVIVTGATSGIGRQTAHKLAKSGAQVILACRNIEQGEIVKTDISRSTGNENIKVAYLDLASLTSVRKFCQNINETEAKLDILINNAAVFPNERKLSVDGFELAFAVNFLGSFLLTNLLLHKLEKSQPSRIINITSAMYEKHPVDLNNLQLESDYNFATAYGRSKTALVMFTVYLAEKLQGKGITCNCLHPGVIQTGLMRDIGWLNSGLVKFLFPCLMSCVTCEKVKTEEEGSQTTIFCAVDPNLKGKTGGYYRDCKEQPLQDFVLDKEHNEKLWNIACSLCELANCLALSAFTG